MFKAIAVPQPIQAMDLDFGMSRRDVQEDLQVGDKMLLRAEQEKKPIKRITTAVPGVILVTFQHPITKTTSLILVREVDPVSKAEHTVGYVRFERQAIGVGRVRYQNLLTPHATFAERAQGKGYASAIYKWALNQGMCFMSSGIQSPGANMMWEKLGRVYPWFLIRVRVDRLTEFLGQGEGLTKQQLSTYEVRLVLLGKGWTLEKFMKQFKVSPTNTMPKKTGEKLNFRDVEDNWDDDDEDGMEMPPPRRPIRPGPGARSFGRRGGRAF